MKLDWLSAGYMVQDYLEGRPCVEYEVRPGYQNNPSHSRGVHEDLLHLGQPPVAVIWRSKYNRTPFRSLPIVAYTSGSKVCLSMSVFRTLTSKLTYWLGDADPQLRMLTLSSGCSPLAQACSLLLRRQIPSALSSREHFRSVVSKRLHC